MSLQERLEKARKLAEIMGKGREPDYKNSSLDPNENGSRKSLEERSRNYQIELRAKHMTTAQLDALIEFYESDMGVSIIESGANITQEFKETFHNRISSAPPKEGEPGWVVSRTDVKPEDEA